MDFKIAVLAGDGIGPEISVQGVDVMTAVCEKFGHTVSYEYAICGAVCSMSTSPFHSLKPPIRLTVLNASGDWLSSFVHE